MNLPHLQVLFLCTGNYYRSRFAEHLFNHHAINVQLPWRAFSRGLAIELLEKDAGALSPFTRQALHAKGIHLADPVRSPLPLTEQDLKSANHIIALKHAEHHALLTKKFPGWVAQVEFWHVHDLDMATPDQALPEIAQAVQALVNRLADQV